MIQTTAGNIWLGLGTLLYGILLLVGTQIWNLPRSDQSGFFILSVLLPPLWLFLALALRVSAANGGLDWLGMSRTGQQALVWIVCLMFLVVTWFSGNMRREPPDQMPWAMRPLVQGAWAMWLFPLVVLLFCLLTIHPEMGAGVPRLALRAPLGAVGGLSLLVSLGMLGQWFVSSQRQQQARADAVVAELDKRDQDRLEEIRKLDAATNLIQALGYTNRYNKEKIRQLALEKIRAVPDLEDQLIAGLRSPWYEQVLIFLDASDPPDNKPLVEPARDAFTTLAAETRKTMQDRNGTVIAGNIDYDARLMLSVADRFRGLGVDYAPVIRDFRSALDLPRDPKVRFESIAALDDWLAHDAKRTK